MHFYSNIKKQMSIKRIVFLAQHLHIIIASTLNSINEATLSIQ